MADFKQLENHLTMMRPVTALTYLLDHDELPLNRKGAAGWVFEDWSGADAEDLVNNGDGTWSLEMIRNRSVAFVPEQRMKWCVIAPR